VVRLAAQPPQEHIFTHIGTRQGLASDEVMSVQQDQKGFIWIATLNGLQRFDGNRFVTFQHSDSDPRSIPSNKVYRIIADKKDRLWIQCGQNDVGYMDVLNFSYHPVPVRDIDSLLSKRAEAGLFLDNNGTVLLEFMRNAVLAYDEQANEFSAKNVPFTFPPKWKPISIMHDRWQNQYWLACDSGLARFNPKTKQLSYRDHNIDNDPVVNAYQDLRWVALPYLDNAGRFWIQSWTPGGPGPYLHSYDIANNVKKEWTLNKVTPMYHEVHSITEHINGTIWISGLNLFASLVKGTDKFEQVKSDQPGEFTIRYDVVRGLYQDRENSLWVSTNKGLYRFNPVARLFNIILNRRQNDPGPYPQDVTDIMQTNNGEILVTTWGEGTFFYDKDFNPVRSALSLQAQKMGEGLMWACLQRSNGDIWRCSQSGFVFITPAGTNKTIKVDVPVVKTATIRQIAEDKKGNIWLGSHQGHLVKWDPSKNTFELVQKLSTIYRLYIDKLGWLWVCTGGNGVMKIDPYNGKTVASYTNAAPVGKKLMGLGAVDITQYNDSTFLIASDALNILNIKTGRIIYFTSDQGLPSNSVNNVIRDRRGYIWVTVENRLCRIQLERSVFSLFNEQDGLPASSYNPASSYMFPDGRIAIGRAHDFVVFDPEKITPDYIPTPDVEITGFAMMNKWLPMDSLRQLPEIELKYNQNSVTIEFSTLTYINQFGIRYMMEGLDKQWIDFGGNRQAIYNYLPPGDYTFKVKAENGDGGPPRIASMKISVRNPFWRTWWFYSILALLAAAFFYWDDRERMRRKAQLQKMRSDIAGNLHEEINLALNNINVLSEIARIKADKEPEQSKLYITEIHHKSHNMIIAMDDMLWSIDPANDSMRKMTDRFKEFADALRNRHNSEINLQTDEKVISLRPDMKIRHEIMIIYKFALRMFVEELKSPQTSIQLDYLRSQLQMNIFSKHVRLGDNNNQVIRIIEEMKQRADSIDALLEIHSDEKGTAVILAVKV
jgi:ligand-binding sensor domain-containing protein